MATQPALLFVGIKGCVVALRRSDGEVVWSSKLRAGTTLVPIVMDARSLYAISGGEVTCLDPATGDTVWHNELKGYGTGFASFAQDVHAVVPAAAAVAAAQAAAAGIAAAGSA
jgi:outer membrane protein assembly factor BamB